MLRNNNLPACLRQVAAQLWNFPDRTTAIGQMISAYLGSTAELDDATVHLLFSANRWEKRCAPILGCLLGCGYADCE